MIKKTLIIASCIVLLLGLVSCSQPQEKAPVVQEPSLSANIAEISTAVDSIDASNEIDDLQSLNDDLADIENTPLK